MKLLIACFGIFTLIIALSGCGLNRVKTLLENEKPPEAAPVADKQEAPPEDFIPGFHPFKDDPDNPSPHNPLVRKFGDIPEVRTYIRLKQKFGRGIGLNIDEAIELYTAEVRLYPTEEAKAALKEFQSDKRRYERLGIPMDGPVMQYNIKPDAKDEYPEATEKDESPEPTETSD